MGFRGRVPRWILGLVWELVGASALILHQHTKIAAFRFPCAIAFPRSLVAPSMQAASPVPSLLVGAGWLALPCLPSFYPCGLPFLASVLVALDYWSTPIAPNEGKTAQNRLKRGKSKTFFEGPWCFLGVLRYLNRAKQSIF